MRIEQVCLRNWCQHEARYIAFSPGLTGLLGANGSGKSNTVKALVFALTGEHRTNDGTKEANVCQGAPKDAHAYVEVVFEHAGTRCRVLRGLSGRRTQLAYLGADNKVVGTVTGDKKVTEAILALLDTTPRILNDFVFVQQGEMFAPFDAARTPAERAAAFQRLFGVERLEQMWEALGETLSALPQSQAPELSGLAEAYAAAQRHTAAVTAQMQPYADLEQWHEATAPETLLLQRYAQAAQQRGAIVGFRVELKNQLVTLQSAKRQMRELDAQMSLLAQALPQALAAKAAAQQLQQEAQRAVDERTRRQALQQEVTIADSVFATAEEHLATVRIAQATGLAEAQLQDMLSEQQAQLMADERFIAQLSGGESGLCPTCGQTLGESAATQLAATRVRVTSLQSAVTMLQSQLLDARQTARLLQQAQQALTQATLIRNNAHRAYRAVGEAHTDQALADLQQRAADAGVTLQKIAGIERAHAEFTGARQAQAATFAAVHPLFMARWQAYRAALAAMVNAPTDAEATAATQALTVARARAQERQGLQLQLSHARELEGRALQDLTLAQQGALIARRQTYVRDGLMLRRQLLHRDNLPKIITRWHLESLRAATNATLDAFQAKFRLLSEAEGLGYRAVFTDGRDITLTRLSGGEKVMAALAFRIAVNARFASRLGLLCLDEPTEWLDADNRRCLEVALGCLREFSQERGLQGIVITHEAVGHLFDHVERFGTP